MGKKGVGGGIQKEGTRSKEKIKKLRHVVKIENTIEL